MDIIDESTRPVKDDLKPNKMKILLNHITKKTLVDG